MRLWINVVLSVPLTGERNSLTVRVGRLGELSLNGAKGAGGSLGICISVLCTTELFSPTNVRQIICTFIFIFLLHCKKRLETTKKMLFVPLVQTKKKFFSSFNVLVNSFLSQCQYA